MTGQNALLQNEPEVRRYKSAHASVEKSGAATFVISSDSLDLDQDRIDAEALKGAIKGRKQLITLWQHKPDQPIGFWSGLRLEGSKVLGDLTLASTNLAQMVRQLLDDDVPLGASIGFMGKGQFNDKGGIDYNAIELLECSVVSVPANPDAQRVAKQFGVDPASFVGIGEPDQSVITIAAGDAAASHEALVRAKQQIARTNLYLRNRK